MESINEIQLRCIEAAFKQGMRSANLDPRDQLAPWLIQGLRALEREESLTPQDVQDFSEMGGTTHPDPTLRSMGK